MTNTVNTLNRVVWMDGLRGFSAFLVIVIHYFHVVLIEALPALQPGTQVVYSQHRILSDTLHYYAAHHLFPAAQSIGQWLWGYWDLGKIGVATFFLISGFVIPYSLRPGPAPLRNFITSRFFRLYPIYWFALLMIALFPTVYEAPHPWWQWLANITMFHKFFLISDINGVTWTLQIELTFYIACALLFWRGILHNRNTVLIGLFTCLFLAKCLAIGRFLTHKELPVAVGLGTSCMFLGLLFRQFQEKLIKPGEFIVVCALWAIAVVGICQIGYPTHAFTNANAYLLALVLFLTAAYWLRPFFSSKIWVFCGAISYSTYLLHPFVGRHTLHSVLAHVNVVSQPYWLWLAPLIGFVATLALSTATYYGIEKTAISLGRKYMIRP